MGDTKYQIQIQTNKNTKKSNKNVGGGLGADPVTIGRVKRKRKKLGKIREGWFFTAIS